MTRTLTIDLPALHPKQAEANGAARFSIYNCGRRWGKDILMQYRAVKRVKFKQPQGWFAPSYRMMNENYNQIYNMLSPIVTRANKSEYRLEMQGGASIEFWSLDNFNTARGRKYAHVTVNEAAASPNLLEAWNYVIRLTLADMRGGADFGSTPKGLNGFHTLWSQAEGNPDWARFHYTTYDNPYIPRDEIDAMKAILPQRAWEQEVMAEFVEDGAYFQNVAACAVIERPDSPDDHAGHYIVAGVDWALSNDYTVITLACRDCNRVVDWDRFNNLDFAYQREKLYTICERWGVSGVLPERNSIGEPNIEIIQDRVIILLGPDGKPGFQTTATSKPMLIQGLAAALEHDNFLVPAEFRDELRSYEVSLSISGSPKFSAPDGLHDDEVISLALTRYAIVSARIQAFI